MAAFHSSDRWFICGIVVIILNIALLSGWYRLRNPLYSNWWPVLSLAEILSAILSTILHSKLSSPPLLLTTALWSLLSLSILTLAIARSYLRVISTMQPGQREELKVLQWTQLVSWIAVPFFVASTACWAQSDSGAEQRVYYRNAGRALNWTGCALLIFCFLCSTGVGTTIALWSFKKSVLAPASTAVFGALFSAPFATTRFAVQMYLMKFRNSNGAEYGLYVGGGIIMDLMVSFINLLFAWYTSDVMKSKNLSSHELCHDLNVRTSLDRDGSCPRVLSVSSPGDRKGSAVSNVSDASFETTTSNLSSTSSIEEGKVSARFRRYFVVSATGRQYEMDAANVLVKNVRRVYKLFYNNFDENLAQSANLSYQLVMTHDAQRALLQIAKLLWLFTLWECSKEQDIEARQAIEVDIIAIWYGDLYQAEHERRPSLVKVMRPFNEIRDAVLGGQPRRPVEKMLARVFLHFFNKIEEHGAEARAAACLFALRSMLKKDVRQTQPLYPSFTDGNEASVLGVDAEMWLKFDELAAKAVV